MIRIFLLFAYCFTTVLSFCQELDPYKYVHVSYKYKQHENIHVDVMGYDTIMDGKSYLKYRFEQKGFHGIH